jgi:hypothetical protein
MFSEHFGKKALEILKEEIYRLREVEDISDKVWRVKSD